MMRRVGSCLVFVLVSACEGGGPVGTLVVDVHGGNEARDGIPASRFVDGYEVRYRHVVVEVEALRLATRTGEEAAFEVSPIVVELVPSPAEAFRIEGIPAQRCDAVGFSSRPVPEGARVGPGVEPAIVDRMREEGWSLYLEGTLIGRTATEERGEIPFELGVPVAVDYLDCSSGDGTLGVVVAPNATTEVEISWHLTHTWFDSYVEDASLRAEAFAAAWPGDRPLRTDDLSAQLLSRMRGVEGGLLVDEAGNPVQYLPGMTAARTLREFMLSHRYAHWNGLEGLCRTELTILR
jgi:hypothetical protein